MSAASSDLAAINVLENAPDPSFEVSLLRLERAALLSLSLGWRFHLGDPYLWSRIAAEEDPLEVPPGDPSDPTLELIDHCIAQL